MDGVGAASVCHAQTILELCLEGQASGQGGVGDDLGGVGEVLGQLMSQQG